MEESEKQAKRIYDIFKKAYQKHKGDVAKIDAELEEVNCDFVYKDENKKGIILTDSDIVIEVKFKAGNLSEATATTSATRKHGKHIKLEK